MINKISETHKRHVLEGVDFLQFDNPKTAIFLIKCAGNDAGSILWSVNPFILGYSEDTIKGVNVTRLLPQSLRDKFQVVFGSLLAQTSVPEVFSTSSNLYFFGKDNRLVYGFWRLLLVNERKSGQLALIFVLRTRKAPKEIAIIDGDNNLQERTPAFQAFLRETDFLSTANFDAAKLWTGLWRKQRTVVVREELSNSMKIPILTLVQQSSKKLPRYSSSNIILISLNSASQKKHTNFTLQNDKETETAMRTICEPEETTQMSHPKNYYTRELMKRNHPYLRMLFLSVTALFVLSLALNVVLTDHINSRSSSLNENISEINALRMRTNSVMSSLRSKELYLINQNFTVFADEGRARADLARIGSQLREMAGLLLGNATRQEGLFRQLLLEPVLPFWRFEVDRFQLYRLSLINLMGEVATRASRLACTPVVNITRENSDFMTLYRNGAVEAMQAFNLSVHVFASQKDEERRNTKESLQQVVFASLCFLAFLSMLSTFPLLILLERQRKLLWKMIMKMPRKLIAQMLNRIYDRLMSLHEYEDSESSSENSEAKAFSVSSVYSISGPMKKLFCAVFLYILIINGSGYCVYYIGITQNEAILIDKPRYIHWAGLRRVIPWLTMFNMRETFLPFNLSFSNIVRESETTFSPFVQWKKSIEELTYLHRCLTYGCPESSLKKLDMSYGQKELLAGSACTNCSVYARHGLTPQVHELVYGELAAFSSFQSHESSSYSLGRCLEKEVSTLGPALLAAVEEYDNETRNRLREAEVNTELTCVGGLAVGFLLLVTVVAPLIYLVRTRQNSKVLRRELQILKNIESIEEAKQET